METKTERKTEVPLALARQRDGAVMPPTSWSVKMAATGKIIKK